MLLFAYVESISGMVQNEAEKVYTLTAVDFVAEVSLGHSKIQTNHRLHRFSQIQIENLCNLRNLWMIISLDWPYRK